jgi:putative membrane protein
MKLAHTLAAAFTVGLIGFGATAQTPAQTTTPVPTPQEFATMAASSDMFEVRAAELALERSQSENVRVFAQMMITDHSAATEQLKIAAGQDGVTLPTEMGAKEVDQLEALNGTADDQFDTAYVEGQIAAHQDALTLLTAFGASGNGPALKTHAQQTAPVVEMHLQHLQAMNGN